MPRKTAIILLFNLLFMIVSGHNDSLTKIITPHLNPALRFTENKGQWQDQVLFRAQLDGGALYVEKNCLTFDFYDKNKFRELHHGGIAKGKYKDLDIKAHSYKLFFEGCNSAALSEKRQEGSDYENFFIGSDQQKWKSGVKNYQQIFLRNIYQGIDYEAITSTHGIKYNFIVKPNTSSSLIKLRYEGVDHIKIKNGTLVIKLSVNEVIEHKPYAYQLINGKVQEVKCNYKLNDKTVSFEFPEGYNKAYELVIDPVLVFAAQSGSLADNFGMTATYDAAGNFYTGGTCFANGYPTTVGAYSTTFTGPVAQGNTDVVITKYNPTGNALLFSTYIGGSSAEIVTSLIVDNSNNLCFYGATGSANFPVTSGCYDNTFNNGLYLSFIYNGTTFNNGTDIYVAKFNSSGTTLMASTYLGGSKNDGVNHVNTLSPLPFPNNNIFEYLPDSLQHNYGDQYRGEIQVDVSNNIYIASSTRSSDFPTVNAFDNTLGGKQDAIVAKFNSALTQLVYSTFLGGSSNDCGNSLIVNINQEVYVTGGTCSPNFPTTVGAYSQSYFGGIADGYLTHLSAGGNAVLQSTFLGTSVYDQSYIVQKDRYNNIYTYGQSLGNMPVVSTTSTPVYSVTNTHQFITRFNNTLSTINMATVFGSNTNGIDISPSAFAVDKCDNIYLSGWGGAIVPPTSQISNMPLASPTQSTTDGNDFYLMGLSPNAGSLLYGSYFGGSLSQEHVDGGTSRFDSRGVIYQSVCAGCGQNQDFPVTPFAWPCPSVTPCTQPNKSNNCNNGVFKINFQLLITVSTINTNTVAGCTPLTVSFTNATPPTGTNTSFVWYLGNGNTTTTNINPVVTYTNPGTYTVSLVVNDPASCNVKDSAITFITVYPAPVTAFSATLAPCTNSVTLTNNSTGSLSANPYVWSFGDGTPTSTLISPSHTYSTNGTYTISLTSMSAGGCTTSATQTVSIFNFTPAVTSASICSGSSAIITATGGTSYSWSPSAGLSNSGAASPVANPTTTTIYTVIINNNLPGYTCSKSLTTQVTVFQKPSAAFSASINPCGGGVNFTDLSVSNISTWQWTLSSTATSTVQNPYNFYFSGGTHTVTLIVVNTDGCKDTAQQVITVGVPPSLSVNASSLICVGNTAQLGATGGGSYQWTPTVSIDYANIANPSASPSITTTYSVVITATNGCVFLLTTTVNVSQYSAGPVSAIADPPYVITGNGTTLIYLGAPGSLVSWLPGGSTTPSTGYTVSATPDRPTTYTAVVNTGACNQRTTVHVEAYTEGCIDKDVYIPNTFTPNSDGHNDLFIVRGLKVQEVYFAVYNRWGEMVFETTDKTKGWDGIYKGRPADVGVFGWYLRVKCFNGEETFRKGNVTLIR
ncbi:MAG: gliding motility-associated C-terminal domain-containing protein [Bacteroidetes bacterium]|nr:gliding motility-associated C-terminal domain-containing protein [Bacteroidota bacterium]